MGLHTQRRFPSKGKAQCCVVQASGACAADSLDSARYLSATMSLVRPSEESISGRVSSISLKIQSRSQMRADIGNTHESQVITISTRTHTTLTHSPPLQKEKVPVNLSSWSPLHRPFPPSGSSQLPVTWPEGRHLLKWGR